MSINNLYIHESAIVSSESNIGAGTKVWVNVQIRENSKIGENCIISKDVYIDEGVHIGDNCKIQNGVSVYKGVTIEDEVFIGPNACFTNDLLPRAVNSDWNITPTTISMGASIGANATIVCGVKVGKYAMIGAGSVVTKDVPDYTLVVGNPARELGHVDKNGNRINNS